MRTSYPEALLAERERVRRQGGTTKQLNGEKLHFAKQKTKREPLTTNSNQHSVFALRFHSVYGKAVEY